MAYKGGKQFFVEVKKGQFAGGQQQRCLLPLVWLSRKPLLPVLRRRRLILFLLDFFLPNSGLQPGQVAAFVCLRLSTTTQSKKASSNEIG